MFSQNILKPIMGRSINRRDNFSSSDHIDIVAGVVVSNLSLFNTFQPFPNRICSIRWLPRRPYTLLVGGKHGELCLIPDVNRYTISGNDEENVDLITSGIGPGGEIRELIPDKLNNSMFYSLNVSGELVKVDMTTHDITVIQPQGDFNIWYGGCNVNFDKRAIFLGDNKGKIHIIPDTTHSGKFTAKSVSCSAKTGKINHIEFHPRNSNLMATASTGDCAVRLWDIRMIKDMECIETLTHSRGVASCYFNKSGQKMLTTDQGNELRIYSSGNWTKLASIKHPHRQFQYISPIRAEWHPLADLVVVGRYPDDKEERKTVDFFDGRDGSSIHSLDIPSQKISSLNRFNTMGDILATMFQTEITIWQQGEANLSSNKQKQKQKQKRRKRSDSDDSDDDDDDDPKKQMKKSKLSVSSSIGRGKSSKTQAKPKLPARNTKKKG